jgi:hypothetical protein
MATVRASAFMVRLLAWGPRDLGERECDRGSDGVQPGGPRHFPGGGSRRLPELDLVPLGIDQARKLPLLGLIHLLEHVAVFSRGTSTRPSRSATR